MRSRRERPVDAGATRVEETGERLTAEAPLEAHRGEVLAGDAGIGAGGAVVLARADVQHADVLLAQLARELGAEQDALRLAVLQPDAAREERRGVAGRELEEARPFEEELAPLREEQREPREIGAALVDFGFGEVGVHREVRPQARRDVVEDVEAGIRVTGRRRQTRAGLVAHRRDAVGLQLQPDTAIDGTKPGEASGVGHAQQAFRALPAGPQALFVLAAHRALEVDAPGVGAGIQVQGAERDLDLGHPALLGAAHAGDPDAVPRLVHVAAELAAAARSGHQPVAHGAGRVDLEEVAGAAVEIGVEAPHEAVVAAEGLVTLHLVGQQTVRFRVETRHAEQQAAAVEGHPHLGALGGLGARAGIALAEVGGGHRPLPDGLVEHAVEDDGFALAQAHGLEAGARVGWVGLIVCGWALRPGHEGGGQYQRGHERAGTRSTTHETHSRGTGDVCRRSARRMIPRALTPRCRAVSTPSCHTRRVPG